MRERRLYLICSSDYLETAFFCGTADECARVLGFRNVRQFHSAVSKGRRIWYFFKVERVNER